MSKYKYLSTEQQINNVLKYQGEELKKIKKELTLSAEIEKSIKESEGLLQFLGYNLPTVQDNRLKDKKTIVIQSWESLCAEAEASIGTGTVLEELFTEDELRTNELVIHQLNKEYNQLYHLDNYDIAISVVAGLLAATIEILLIGIPQKTPQGLKGAPLANFVRDYFYNKFPEAEMNKLANSKVSKVPYDAQDNRNTTIWVEGLSAYYHRLLSLGHDPFLGFIFGVADILNGQMTTIDKTGKTVSQGMEIFSDRRECDIFVAIAKQIIHLKSDITTSMGLPAPLMSLFNYLQFGSIGEEEMTIAEIVQGMYYEGYDFIHFCSLSIPTMIIEVFIRLCYSFKRIKEGHSIKESIPFSSNQIKYPKLGTMLFIAHTSSMALNVGRICFTKNPMVINYPQWIAFAKYFYLQLKWELFNKPSLREAYVRGIIWEDLKTVYKSIDETFELYVNDYSVVIE